MGRVPMGTGSNKGMMFMKNNDTKVVIDDIVANDIDYVVIDQLLPETVYYLVPAVNANLEMFKAVHITAAPENYILQVKK